MVEGTEWHLPDSFSLTTKYYPGLHLKWILEDFHILSLDPSTQDLLIKPPSVTLHQLVDTVSAPIILPLPLAPDPKIDPGCKNCCICHPVNLFTSSCTNLTCPITTTAVVIVRIYDAL